MLSFVALPRIIHVSFLRVVRLVEFRLLGFRLFYLGAKFIVNIESY